MGFLDLPVGTFSDPVVVTDREYVKEVYFFETEVGADLSVLDGEVSEDLRSAFEIAKEMVAKFKSQEVDG